MRITHQFVPPRLPDFGTFCMVTVSRALGGTRVTFTGSNEMVYEERVKYCLSTGWLALTSSVLKLPPGSGSMPVSMHFTDT